MEIKMSQVCNNCFFRSLDSCSHPEYQINNNIKDLYYLIFDLGQTTCCEHWRAREEWQLPVVDYKSITVRCNRCKKSFPMAELHIQAKGSQFLCINCKKECI